MVLRANVTNVNGILFHFVSLKHTRYPPSIQSLVTIKLSSNNYLLWRAQITPYLKGQHLFGYINGNRPQPVQYISNPAVGSSTTAPLLLNPEFTYWFDQD
jgi:hypothetical protein